MPERTHLRDITLGDFEATFTEVAIRLFATPGDDDKIRFVEFEIHPVKSIGPRGERRFDAQEADEFDTPDLDSAKPTISGFTKWDSCTEISGYAHTCGIKDWTMMLEALALARREARAVMAQHEVLSEDEGEHDAGQA